MLLGTGKILKQAFFTVAIVALIVYMGTSWSNYQTRHGSTETFVLPTEVRIGILVLVGVILLINLFPKRKKFH